MHFLVTYTFLEINESLLCLNLPNFYGINSTQFKDGVVVRQYLLYYLRKFKLTLRCLFKHFRKTQANFQKLEYTVSFL